MADAYTAWLQECIDWHKDCCLKDAEAIGYPGKIRYANPVMREALETYEECLANYEALMIRPSLPGYPTPPPQDAR